MSSTFTIRISRELKEKMKKLPAEWSEELRSFIEQRIKHLELMRTIEEIESRAEKRRLTPVLDSNIILKLITNEPASKEARTSMTNALREGLSLHSVDMALSETLNAVWKHVKMHKAPSLL